MGDDIVVNEQNFFLLLTQILVLPFINRLKD